MPHAEFPDLLPAVQAGVGIAQGKVECLQRLRCQLGRVVAIGKFDVTFQNSHERGHRLSAANQKSETVVGYPR